jgi:hypothetical protein
MRRFDYGDIEDLVLQRPLNGKHISKSLHGLHKDRFALFRATPRMGHDHTTEGPERSD